MLRILWLRKTWKNTRSRPKNGSFCGSEGRDLPPFTRVILKLAIPSHIPGSDQQDKTNQQRHQERGYVYHNELETTVKSVEYSNVRSGVFMQMAERLKWIAAFSTRR